jgi:6-phosphogluconolactonase
VIQYAIDTRSGALQQVSTLPLAKKLPVHLVDKTGRYLFGASYRGHLISLNGIGAEGDVTAEPLQAIPAGRNAHSVRTDGSNCFVYLPPRHGSEFTVQLRRQSGLTLSATAAVFLKPAFSGPCCNRATRQPTH